MQPHDVPAELKQTLQECDEQVFLEWLLLRGYVNGADLLGPAFPVVTMALTPAATY